MFKALFGDVTNGRLARLPYLGYMVLISILVFGFMFGIVALVSSSEHLMNGDIQQIQASIMNRFGMIFMLLTMIFFVVIAFASLNIGAKRFRDMGLPGWISVLILIILSSVIAALFPGHMETVNGADQMVPSTISSAFQAIVLLCLLLIPGNSFGKND